MDQQTCAADIDRAIAKLAAAQHGVVARAQLAGLGVSETMIRNRMWAERLLRLHRGVYAVGHAHLRREGHWLAAVLAVGPGAVLSHRDAAGLHDLRPANHPRTDVTTAKRGRSSQPRIAVHHATVLTSLDVTTVNRIPVTTVARTLVDLAGVVPRQHLVKALSEADRQGKLDVRALTAAIHRTRGRHGRGHANLMAVLEDHAAHGVQLTRSELEVRFLALVARSNLPRPRTNVWLDGVEVDALWPERRVAVELDGYLFHAGRRAFQRDRVKGNMLTLAGFTMLRYTHHDIAHDPDRVAAELRAILVG